MLDSHNAADDSGTALRNALVPPRTGPPDLNHLFIRFQDEQWHAATDLAWDTAAPADTRLFADTALPAAHTAGFHDAPLAKQLEIERGWARWLLTQIVWAEHAAMLTSLELAKSLPSLDARQCAIYQAQDEGRHAEAFARYLDRLGGPLELTDPLLPTLFGFIGAQRTWMHTLVGQNVILEGLATAGFKVAHTFVNDPLLKALIERVSRDENRHVMFGTCMRDSTIPSLASDHLESLQHFAYDCCRLLLEPSRQFQADMQARADAGEAGVQDQLGGQSAWVGLMTQMVRDVTIPLLKRHHLFPKRLRGEYARLDLAEAATE